LFLQGEEPSEADTRKYDMAVRTEVVEVVMIPVTAKVTVGVPSASINL
jgi:hypothetical protein